MLLTDLFLASARRLAGHAAVEVPPSAARPTRVVVTYGQLAAMADTLREQLAEFVDGETAVVVLLPRENPWLYAAQLGVLWAGGAHVCLDASFPDGHLAHVVKDASATCVITTEAQRARFASLGVPVVVVPADVPVAELPVDPIAPHPAWCSESTLAYVIYTSGTTGKPKGVLLEHRGVVNLIREGVARFDVQSTDRMAQNSSPAYDSSVEEIWLAFAAGATLVVLDDEVVRMGPDLVPWLRRERISILCPPPTLLRTMQCRSPAQELPALRMCYVGGEPLSSDLADLWGDALRLENGYGPTECTVTVVRGQVHPGEPVTIGEPVPPHVAHVLDDELRPVDVGTPGELCIAGPGLARGYLGLPEMTVEKFPELSGIGRVYRTGDLVVRLPDGRLNCIGRIDAQVKIRGYRIELEAIEAVLAGCEGVREAVCCAQGEEPERFLVAHVVPEDPARRPSPEQMVAAVRRELPDYMVPSQFAFLERAPRTVGGKIDRRALPSIDLASSPAIGERLAKDAPIEQALRQGFAQVLGVSLEDLQDDADFFACGGNSLRAAMLISLLRRHDGMQSVAVRDLYSNPTVQSLQRALADRQSSGPVERGGDPDGHPSAVGSLAGYTIAQVSVLGSLLLLAATGLWAGATLLLPWLFATFSLATVLFVVPWLAPVVAIIGLSLSVLVAVACKRALIGRYREQRVPAWSGLRLRNWIVCRLVQLVPWSLIEGTELHCVVLRTLGAKIGRRVHIHRGVDLYGGGWDLLELGDDVSLGRDVDLGLCELDDGELVMGPVRVEAGATLCVRAGTGPGVTIGAGAFVRPLSFVAAGGRVDANTVVDGVPAQPAGTTVAPPEVAGGWSPWTYAAFVMSLRLLLGPLLAMPAALVLWLLASQAGIDAQAVGDWLCVDGPSASPTLFLGLVLLAVVALPFALLQTALLLRILPKVPAGSCARWSPRFWWLSLRMRWLEGAGEWLSGTLFWPWWLRLSGMRVGADVEVSTILDVLPEQVELGGHSFLADGVYLAVPEVHRGTVTVASTALGAGSFVGNHVVIEAGQHMPEGLLLGMSTVADAQTMKAGSSWFGHPAFALPQREIVAVDRSLTYEPGPIRYCNRLFWEALRLLLPALPMALLLWWFDVVVAFGWSGALFATAGAAAALAMVVLVMKWLLLGRVQPGQHGLWSCWASRWDFHYVMWQRYGRALLTPLEGTLLLPWYLRAMGMRIGRRCVLGDGFAQVVDPDMITIEDGATVHALFQAHSFEDRVLKIDRVRLGRRSTVGKAAVVLYGADIGDDTHVMPHSVVMKHEMLLPRRRYAGAPTVEVQAGRES